MKRVIVVEDSPEIGRLIKSSLDTLNIDLDIKVLPSAEEAQIEIFRQRVDLLITDIRLPGITGLDLVKKVKKTYSNIKIIIVTGLLEEEFGKKINEINPDAFFRKPININRFLREVGKVLGCDDELGQYEQTVSKSGVDGAESVKSFLNNIFKDMDSLPVALVSGSGKILATTSSFEVQGEITDFIDQYLLSVVDPCSKASLFLNSKRRQFEVKIYGDDYIAIVWSVADNYIVAKLPANYADKQIEKVISGLNDLKNELLLMAEKGIKEEDLAADIDIKLPVQDKIGSDEVQPPKGLQIDENELINILKSADEKNIAQNADEFWESEINGNVQNDDDTLTLKKAKAKGLLSNDFKID